jgi:peptidyl-prolyl cis-trans isomerase SurA
MLKNKGQELELRHILLTPTVTEELWMKKKKLLWLKSNKELTEEATRTLSDEKETRANGGALINQNTRYRFELTKWILLQSSF